MSSSSGGGGCGTLCGALCSSLCIPLRLGNIKIIILLGLITLKLSAIGLAAALGLRVQYCGSFSRFCARSSRFSRRRRSARSSSDCDLFLENGP